MSLLDGCIHIRSIMLKKAAHFEDATVESNSLIKNETSNRCVLSFD